MNLRKKIDEFCNIQSKVRLTSDNTIKAYEVDLGQFVKFMEKDVDKITTKDLRSFLSYLSQKNISKRSVSRKLSSIRAFFKWLHSSTSMKSNPALLLSSPKFSKELPDVIMPEEFNSMVESLNENNVQQLRDKLLVTLLYSSGVRSAEALSIEIDDISFERCEVRVIGKGGVERIAFFSNETKRLFLKYIRARGAVDSKYIFTNSRGGVISSRFLRLTVEKLAEKSGIDKKVSPHTFRHSFATLLLSNGVNLKAIQELLGHASISSTQIYTHISKEELRRCYLKYGPSFGKGGV